MSLKSDQKAILEKILALPVGDLELAGYGISSEYEGKQLTKAELVMIQLVDRGCKGDMFAIREILDRLLGKPAQKIEAKVETRSYYDFLMTIVEEDQKKKPLPPEIIEIKQIEEKKELPGHDLLGDLG